MPLGLLPKFVFAKLLIRYLPSCLMSVNLIHIIILHVYLVLEGVTIRGGGRESYDHSIECGSESYAIIQFNAGQNPRKTMSVAF